VETDSLRSLIRAKLQQGLLPYDSIPRVWGSVSAGETCDGCDFIIEPPELVIEGISLADGDRPIHVADRRRPLQLHVLCFYVWDAERRS